MAISFDGYQENTMKTHGNQYNKITELSEKKRNNRVMLMTSPHSRQRLCWHGEYLQVNRALSNILQYKL